MPSICITVPGTHSAPDSVNTTRRSGWRSRTPPNTMHQSGRCAKKKVSMITIAKSHSSSPTQCGEPSPRCTAMVRSSSEHTFQNGSFFGWCTSGS